MMKYLVLVVKGMVYGLTHIVPGIGGATVMIAMRIYEPFVEAVGNVFIRLDRWREYVPFLGAIGIGMVLSVLGFATLVTGLLARYPAPTMFFFLGLLLGVVPSILRMHGDMRITWPRAAALVLGLVLVVLLRTMQEGRLNELLSPNGAGTSNVAYYLVTSVMAGAASVTPGLDGSYMLLLAGTYEPIMAALSNISSGTIEWLILVPTVVGALVGIVGFSKLVDSAIRRAPSVTYYAVLGLIAGSVYGLWPRELTIRNLPLSLLTLGVGLAIALYTSRPAQAEEEETREPVDEMEPVDGIRT